MALSDKQSLGTWNSGIGPIPLKVRKVGTKLFVTQTFASYPETIVVRGEALLTAQDITAPATPLTEAEIDSLEASDATGFQTPSSFTAEEGFLPIVLSDGTPAYRNETQYRAKLQADAAASYTDNNGDGVADRSADPLKAKLFENPAKWAEENPVGAGLILLGLFLLYKLFTTKPSKRKKILGF